MKSKISTFLLGILVTICIGAGVSNSELLTVKPATPKVVFTKTVYLDEAQLLINEYVSKGYILKSYNGYGVAYHGLLIMEKY